MGQHEQSLRGKIMEHYVGPYAVATSLPTVSKRKL